jgi:hypothetical protein
MAEARHDFRQAAFAAELTGQLGAPAPGSGDRPEAAAARARGAAWTRHRQLPVIRVCEYQRQPHPAGHPGRVRDPHRHRAVSCPSDRRRARQQHRQHRLPAVPGHLHRIGHQRQAADADAGAAGTAERLRRRVRRPVRSASAPPPCYTSNTALTVPSSIAPVSASTLVDETICGSPAAAGMTGRSVITAVNGKPTPSPGSLTAALGGLRPADTITVSWVSPSGRHATTSIRLLAGPPQ